jgi:hypothetical protein
MGDTQTTRWKVVEIVIGPTKNAKWAEGEDWEWKKPFQELKKSVIRAEDKWHILIKVDEEEKDAIYAMCDGRLKVETVMEQVEEKEPEKAEETTV